MTKWSHYVKADKWLSVETASHTDRLRIVEKIPVSHKKCPWRTCTVNACPSQCLYVEMKNYPLDPASLVAVALQYPASQFHQLFHIHLLLFSIINHLYCPGLQFSKVCLFQLDARVTDITRQLWPARTNLRGGCTPAGSMCAISSPGWDNFTHLEN